MPGEKAIHVALDCRNSAVIAGHGDRADETGAKDRAVSTRSPRSPPRLCADEVLEPFGAAFAADESGGKIAIKHIEPTESLEDLAQARWRCLEHRRREDGTRSDGAIDVDEQGIFSSPSTRGGVGRRENLLVALKRAERDRTGASEFVDRQPDDLP